MAVGGARSSRAARRVSAAFGAATRNFLFVCSLIRIDDLS